MSWGEGQRKKVSLLFLFYYLFNVLISVFYFYWIFGFLDFWIVEFYGWQLVRVVKEVD